LPGLLQAKIAQQANQNSPGYRVIVEKGAHALVKLAHHHPPVWDNWDHFFVLSRSNLTD
jgi:hypothetical protein